MNKTQFYVKCLELMGWRVSPRDHAFFLWSPTNERFTPTWDELPDFTIPKLIKREDVMERVCNFVNQKIDEWDGSEEMPPPIDYCKGEIRAFIFPVGWVLKDFAWLLDKYAIPLGITPEQLMGVEG